MLLEEREETPTQQTDVEASHPKKAFHRGPLWDFCLLTVPSKNFKIDVRNQGISRLLWSFVLLSSPTSWVLDGAFD